MTTIRTVQAVYIGRDVPIHALIRLDFPAGTHPADTRDALAEALQKAYRLLAEEERAER